MKKMSKVIALSLVAMGVAGCVSSTAPNVYKRSELQQAHITNWGTVLSLKQVFIEGEGNSLVNAVGAVAGAIGASHLGGGSARIVTGAVGALASGYLTNAISTQATATQGIEFTVRLDNKNVLTFVQEGDIKYYHVNQRVKLVTDSTGKTRIDNF